MANVGSHLKLDGDRDARGYDGMAQLITGQRRYVMLVAPERATLLSLRWRLI